MKKDPLSQTAPACCSSNGHSIAVSRKTHSHGKLPGCTKMILVLEIPSQLNDLIYTV